VHRGSSPGLIRAIARAGIGVAIVAGARQTPDLRNRPIAIDGVLQKSKLLLAWPNFKISASAEQLVDDIRGRVANREPVELEVDRIYNLLS
jgi:hypothetical protein